MKHVVLDCLLTLASAGGVTLATACSAAERLHSEAEMVVPLSELSGLALRATSDGHELLAVGDEARAIIAMPLHGGLPNTLAARRIALPMPEVAGGSELEGIAVDSAGKVWVLTERGQVYVYELSGDTATELWHRPIVLLPGHPLAAAWEADANARAEGIALVGPVVATRAGATGGRIFIVKQAAPAALIELMIDGDRLVAGLAHTLVDMDDASDLVAADGGLYVIGSRSEKIGAIPVPGEKGGAGPLSCTRMWPLPSALGKGTARWEGLAFLPDGKVVVGVDRKKTDRPNLAILAPLVH